MLFEKQRQGVQKASIRYIIFIYFTLTALAASVFIGISLYTRLSGQMADTIQEENQILINQINRSMDSYLQTIMKLSDSLYYGVIKNADLSDGSIGSEITLLYDNNKDNIENIALLSKNGQMLESVPAAGWEIREYTYDLHHSDMADGNIMTEYEEKFSSMGNAIFKLVAERKRK